MGSPSLSTIDENDPGFEYHQDYYSSYQNTRSSTVILFLVIAGTILYQFLYWLDFDLLPLQQFLWNWLVFLTPFRLLELLDVNGSLDSLLDSASAQSPSSIHARKSAKMRRVLGMDKGGSLMETVAQASRRRLSTFTSPDRGSVPPGLGNLDNSCYQNSVLQGLASLDSFSEYLVEPNHHLDSDQKERHTSAMPMAGSLRGLIADLKGPANNGKRIWTPPTLKNMSSWQQQDAQEYFSKVMDEVDKEVANATRAANEVGGLKANFSRETPEASSAGSNTTKNPLEGMLVQRVGCTTCGHSEGLSMIPFNCLTVPIERDHVNEIAECLDAYTKLERIEGVECGKCTLLKSQHVLATVIERMTSNPGTTDKMIKYTRQRLEAVTEALEEDDYCEKTLREKCVIPTKNRTNTVKTRQAVIARPPKSLVIHINRSLFNEMDGELVKNYAPVLFPKRLDLSPWCLGITDSKGTIQTEEWSIDPLRSMIASSHGYSPKPGPVYELRAAVTHYGRHENGHYICYRKHLAPVPEEKDVQDDVWWRLSDDEVTSVTEQEVLDQGGVFMLFYDRVYEETGASTPENRHSPSLEPMSALSEEIRAADLAPSPSSLHETQFHIPLSEPTAISTDEVPGADLVPASNSSPGEIQSLAAKVPLPSSASPDFGAESSVEDDDTLPPDSLNSLPMSRDPSHASSDTTDDHIDRNNEDCPPPTKPILIKPFIQQHGYRDNEKDDNSTVGKDLTKNPSNLVMV